MPRHEVIHVTNPTEWRSTVNAVWGREILGATMQVDGGIGPRNATKADVPLDQRVRGGTRPPDFVYTFCGRWSPELLGAVGEARRQRGQFRSSRRMDARNVQLVRNKSGTGVHPDPSVRPGQRVTLNVHYSALVDSIAFFREAGSTVHEEINTEVQGYVDRGLPPTLPAFDGDAVLSPQDAKSFVRVPLPQGTVTAFLGGGVYGQFPPTLHEMIVHPSQVAIAAERLFKVFAV